MTSAHASTASGSPHDADAASRKRKSRSSPVDYSSQMGKSGGQNSNGDNLLPRKKIKVEEEHTTEITREEELVLLISGYNLAANELFQLKEYGSLVEWNPSDFSSAANSQIPEIFQYFIEQNRYKLIWDEDSMENMDSMPLRLQKKKLQEREEMLRKKYPFMDEVNQRAAEAERELLSFGLKSIKSEPKHAIKAKPAKSKSKSARKLDTPAELELDEELDEEMLELYSDIDTNYKLKDVVYTIPPPIVTHPSHIPSWRPQDQSESAIHGETENTHHVLDYDFEPIKVISTKKKPFLVPQIEAKISDFVKNKFQAAIVDDGGVEYSNTPEESRAILDQQRHMLERLYHKIMVEERFELNGDKIERRKVILPNVSVKMTDPFRDTGSIVPKIQGASNDQTYQDHFIAQGMAYSKICLHYRKQRIARVKRIAQMIEQHFRKKAGEKERLAREREQNLRRISRLAIQAVKKRWSQANKVYRVLQNEKEEELKQIEGREHLSKMLEHSTQLLEAQLNRSSHENTEAESAADSAVDSDDDSNAEDSENFSSSSESDDEQNEENHTDKGDNELSVEELRKKYNLMESSVEPTSEMNGTNSELGDESSLGNGNGLAALYENGEVKAPVSLEYTDDQKKLIEITKSEKNEMLDSDEFSDSMSDETSSSDESESGEEASESESEVEIGSNGSGLAGFYQTKEDVEMEEAEQSEKSTEEEEEPKTPGSADSEKDEKVEEINGFKVKDVPVPSLLRGTLRPYQKQGLNWLASLYNNNTNGILADEMGLGKTIQTISLLSYLACEHHIWGPHLIVVPTSVMLNWEMEFKKFAPGFKVLTYYGSPQERARKRKGWNKMDAFHVCITSYQLVVHDHSSFKRRRWRYMILDEAHNIKNFRSTRWKSLLNFNTENRLLLTGTPLQNNLMELWSLLYFLMPSSKVDQMMPEGFANFEDFQQWFGKPVDKILEKTNTGDIIDENVTSKLDKDTRDTVARLHQVLRPYLLRRLKKDVEKQMPGKYEHIVYCRLSKRQRYLYDDFMSRAKTRETLSSGNFLSIINCLMQLRKVCNHPDLFEVRPIVTSYAIPKTVTNSFKSYDATVRKLLSDVTDEKSISFPVLNLDVSNKEDMNYFAAQSCDRLKTNKKLEEQIAELDKLIEDGRSVKNPSLTDVLEINRFLKLEEQIDLRERLKQALYLNTLRCRRAPIHGCSFFDFARTATKKNNCETYNDMVLSIPQRAGKMKEVIDKYAVITPLVVTLDMKDQIIPISTQYKVRDEVLKEEIQNPFHEAQVKLSIAFPDKQLLQYDCGKLQKLASLLQDLVPNGHRALIFTQMTKVLDILEQFLNIHGYRYMRLDGATKIEDRQLMTEKFNRDPKIPVFILSTRSGGLGINLTGADTVIFYDSDWNPAMDKQCQDRCHRIGQSRDVHIYRFVSEYTIESNILKKANQKRQLDNVVIQEGDFTTDYLGKFSVRDLVNDSSTIIGDLPDKPIGEDANIELLAQAEDEADRNAAREAMKEVAVDDEDFNEESKASSEKPEKSSLDDEDYDAGVGHIDEYMLRYIGEGYYVE